MMIHTFRLQDAALISQLQGNGTHLDLRRALLWPHNSVSAAMSAYWPFSRRSVHTLVLSEKTNGTQSAGFLQYRERRDFPEADILFCAPALQQADDEQRRRIWHELITQMIVRVGEHGCQRVYARVLDGAPELDLFWRLGFSAYARVRAYRRVDPPNYATSLLEQYWRPQRSKDMWNVGQLYLAVTPKLVQQAENLPQNDCFLPYRDGFGGDLDRRYVWSVKDEVGASLRLIRGHESAWLKFIVHPSYLDRADELLQDAMRLVPPAAEKLYVSMREYHSELEGAIMRAGFSWLATEMLMVKHTTALIKKPVLKQLAVMEGVEARPTATSTRMTK
jgi:hypothetical protein